MNACWNDLLDRESSLLSLCAPLREPDLWLKCEEEPGAWIRVGLFSLQGVAVSGQLMPCTGSNALWK